MSVLTPGRMCRMSLTNYPAGLLIIIRRIRAALCTIDCPREFIAQTCEACQAFAGQQHPDCTRRHRPGIWPAMSSSTTRTFKPIKLIRIKLLDKHKFSRLCTKLVDGWILFYHVGLAPKRLRIVLRMRPTSLALKGAGSNTTISHHRLLRVNHLSCIVFTNRPHTRQRGICG